MFNSDADSRSGSRKQQEINRRVKQPNRVRLEKLLQENDKGHWIHNIRGQILTCEYLNETLETLDEMCLDELFWVFEQMVVKSKFEEAMHKDSEKSG